LVEAAVLDAVEHAAEHACGVPDRFLAAELGLAGAEVADVRPLVMRRDLERRPSAGGGLLEDQGDIPPRQPVLVVTEAEALFGPEVTGECRGT
jgi:hypothetical protein